LLAYISHETPTASVTCGRIRLHALPASSWIDLRATFMSHQRQVETSSSAIAERPRCRVR